MHRSMQRAARHRPGALRCAHRGLCRRRDQARIRLLTGAFVFGAVPLKGTRTAFLNDTRACARDLHLYHIRDPGHEGPWTRRPLALADSAP